MTQPHSKKISVWLVVGLLATIGSIPLLIRFSTERDRVVRQVVLTPQGCLTAAQLEIPTRATSGGCVVEQPGMHKYTDEVELADGKRLSASVVTGWSK